MITVAAAIAFIIGFLLAELREGWIRLLGMWAMVGAAAAGLALTTSPPAAAWAAGPIVASALLTSRPAPPLAFERLMLRTAVTIALVFLGGYVARRLPFGDQPWPLLAMGWVLAAVGLSWIAVPRDRVEVRRGAVLAIAGGSAVLLTVFPTGAGGAALTGLASMAPLLGERSPVSGRSPIRSSVAPAILGLLAAILAGLAISGGAGGPGAPAGLALSLTPGALTGSAILVTIAAFSRERTVTAAALPAGVSLLLATPAPHWAGFAAAVALLAEEAAGARLLWTGITLLGLAPALSALIGGPLGARWEAALLAPGWLLALLPGLDGWEGSLLLAASTFLVAGDLRHLSPGGLERFQWLSAAGAGLILLRAAWPRSRGMAPAPSSLRSAMSAGLVLTGVSTASALGLLGAALLVIDLSVVQPSAPTGPPAGGRLATLALLARSGWPPAAAFSGRVLVLLAATAASPLLAVSGILLVGGLQLAPGWDASPPARTGPARIRDWLAAAISLGAGFAPAIVMRMLQGS